MSDSSSQTRVKSAVHNGIPHPREPLPLPERPEIVTANMLQYIKQTSNPRLRLIYQKLVEHLHAFVLETNLSTEEWMAGIEFITRTGQMCTPLRQEMILLSDVLGVSAVVSLINNPAVGGSSETSLTGPFFAEDAQEVEFGGSIASEGKGEYMYVEGRVLTIEGNPIANALIETWETDDHGYYDVQYLDRTHPDCRGKVRTREDGSFGYRAVVPIGYPIPGDGPPGELLIAQGRHNMRPSHIHAKVEAPGYNTVVTALFLEGDEYLEFDAVFGVKKSLVVKLEQIDDEGEARRRGFPKGSSFKLLRHDFVLLTEEQMRLTKQELAKKFEETYPGESL